MAGGGVPGGGGGGGRVVGFNARQDPVQYGDQAGTLDHCLTTNAVLVPVLMRQREGKPGGGKGPLLSTDQSLTFATNNDQYLFEPVPFRKVRRAQSSEDDETWELTEVANTLNTYENSDVRATQVVVEGFPDPAGALTTRYFKGINTTMDDGALVVEAEDGTMLRAETSDGIFYRVRRLTPMEGERLMGFPDGWTLPAKSDSARFRCLGNAVVVPLAEWVFRRILEVEMTL